MIKVNCKKCGEEIIDNGAILWSEQDKDEKCKKTHLCKECYGDVIKYISKK